MSQRRINNQVCVSAVLNNRENKVRRGFAEGQHASNS